MDCKGTSLTKLKQVDNLGNQIGQLNSWRAFFESKQKEINKKLDENHWEIMSLLKSLFPNQPVSETCFPTFDDVSSNNNQTQTLSEIKSTPQGQQPDCIDVRMFEENRVELRMLSEKKDENAVEIPISSSPHHQETTLGKGTNFTNTHHMLFWDGNSRSVWIYDDKINVNSETNCVDLKREMNQLKVKLVGLLIYGEDWLYSTYVLILKTKGGDMFYSIEIDIEFSEWKGGTIDWTLSLKVTFKFAGEFICKYLDRLKFAFCLMTMHDGNAICVDQKVRNLVSATNRGLAYGFDRFHLESYIEDNKRVKWCSSVLICGNAIQVCDLCNAINALVYWIRDIIVKDTLLEMLGSMGLVGISNIYAIVCVISWIFVFLKVHETKSKSLKVITEFYADGARLAIHLLQIFAYSIYYNDPMEDNRMPNLILDLFVSFVHRGCLPSFIDLIRSIDKETMRLGLLFMELILILKKRSSRTRITLSGIECEDP